MLGTLHPGQERADLVAERDRSREPVIDLALPTSLQAGASVFEGADEGHDLAEGATGVGGGLDEIDSSAGRVQVGQHFPAQPAPDQSTVSW